MSGGTMASRTTPWRSAFLVPMLLAIMLFVTRDAVGSHQSISAAAAAKLRSAAEHLHLSSSGNAAVLTRRNAQQAAPLIAAIKSVLSSMPKALSNSANAAELPSTMTAEFGLFTNAAGATEVFVSSTTPTPNDKWRNDALRQIATSSPWVGIMSTKPADNDPGWIFRATIAVAPGSMGMRLATGSPLTVLKALAAPLGLDNLGVFPKEEPAGAIQSFTIEMLLNSTTGNIKEFGFQMGGGAMSLANVASKLGMSVSSATTGITLSNPSFFIECPADNTTTPKMIEIGGTVSGIPFLPAGSYFDATLVIRPLGAVSIEAAGNMPLIADAITLNAFSLAVNNTARTLYASVVLSCPDAGINRAAGALIYNDGALKVTVEGIGSILDGKITLTQLMFDYGKNGTYVAGSANGGLAGYVGTIAVNMSRTPVNGKRPTSFALSLPEVNVGTVVRVIGPTADRLLPDFVKNTNLPKLLLETTDEVSGTGVNATLTSTYHVAVGPHSTTGIFADFTFDSDGILVGNVTMDKALDLATAVSVATGMQLPVDVRGVIYIREPYIRIVSKRAPGRGLVPADADLGTRMGFGLQIPALMGDSYVFANALLVDGNETRVGKFEVGWAGNFSPVKYVSLRGALVRFEQGKGAVVIANGTLANVAVAAVLNLKGGKDFTLTAEASNAQVASALKTLFPATPDLIIKVLDPVRFSKISFGWDSVTSAFSCEANPDLSGVPGLRDLINFLGFKQDDMKVRPKLNELAIEIAITKAWELRMGGPFVGTSLLQFALALSQNSVSTQFAAKADFQAQIRLPFLEPEVIWMGMGATVAYDSTAPPPSVSFAVRAAISATTNPFYIKGFPWVKIAYIGGEIGLTPMAPPPFVSLYRVALAAKGSVLSTEVDFALWYDQPTADFAVQFAVSNVDLQRMLNEMGVRAALGPFNILVRDARMSYARQPVKVGSGSIIPAGFKLGADIEFMTIGAKIDVMLDTSGFEAYFEVRDVTRARIIAEALAKAQKVLDALKINVQLQNEIRLELVRIHLVLRTTRVAFRFGVKAYLFGVNMDFDVVLDTATTPWDQVLETLTDKFIEPLTAACTKDTYTRGSSFVDRCPAGQERQGDFCYPTCPTDWLYGSHGKTNICYQNCPPGYKDDGVGGTGLTCSQIACNAGQIYDGALTCWNACQPGYTYKATRCYKNCPAGWSNDATGLSCERNTCEGNDEDNGAGLCYPACAAGYTSNKLTMCIETNCPWDYRNDPLSCWRGAHSYGKCCCTVFSKSCCGACNAGYTDTGCTCYRGPSTIWKKTYDRGVGYPKFRTFVKDSYLDSSTSALRSFAKKTQWRDTKPLVCGPDKDYDGAAICYDKCAAGYTGNSFMCWQNCPANKGLIDCGSYCAPKSAGSCANFIGATYQNCKNKYPARRMVLDMVLSGNYTDEQIQAAAAGDATVFQAPATDTHPATIIDYTSQSSVDTAESSGLLLPNATTTTRPALIHTTEEDEPQRGAAATAVAAPAADSWQHVRIMHEAESEAEDAHIHNRVLQAGAPGSNCVPGDKRASCWCADKDDGVYTDPAGTKNRYAICGQGTGVLQRCPVNEVFSATRSRCVHRNEESMRVPTPVTPGSAIPTPPKSCTDRDNGIYFRDSRNITSSYKCDNGVIIPKFCPNGKYLDKASNECKPNPTPVRKPPPPCKDPECFCLDKADRRYVDVLTADPQKYITCANGTGEWGACEQYNQYNRVTGECGFVPPNATEPIADCKGVACFCIGRADGIYSNPWTDKAGINCVAEYGSEIACEPDFKFVVTASPCCQPRNAAEMMRAMNARRDRRLLV